MSVVPDFFDELQLWVKKVIDEVRRIFFFSSWECVPDLQLSNPGLNSSIV